MTAPWFKFFPADWLLSASVRLMTAEQRGVYLQLLAEQWYSGNGLPSDENLLVRLAGCTSEEWKRSKEPVLKHFVTEDGRLWNPKLRELQAEAIALGQERSEAGKQGNVKRWGHRKSDRSAIPNASQSDRESDTDSDTDTDIPSPSAIVSLAKRRLAKTTLPEHFSISDAVRRWAKDHGYARLEDHFEYFTGYARANGKTYADWDQAFKNAIRENWARVEQKPCGNGATLLERMKAQLEAE